MFKDDLICALDPVAFSRKIGLEPDPWQAEVLRFEGKRLLLNCSRQSGKSTTAATKALHTGIYKPNSLILVVSPSLRQSQELFRKVKTAYAALDSKPALVEDNKLSMQFSNGSRIISLPGDQATVRGYSGVNLLLEDEGAQVSDEFYFAILPMLVINDGQFIIMSTPYGKRGHFFQEWTEGGPDWKRIEISADKCPRITDAELERQRRSLGDMFFRQEFLCEFCDTEEQTFGYDLVVRAFDETIEPLF